MCNIRQATGLVKNLNIFRFPIIEMAANNAEISRIGKLEAEFQQVLFIQIFCNFHIIVVKH